MTLIVYLMNCRDLVAYLVDCDSLCLFEAIKPDALTLGRKYLLKPYRIPENSDR